MAKVDFKKELKHLYQTAAQTPALVEAPRLPFLMLNGGGDPDANPDFQGKVEALFAASYALKFLLKNQGWDYVVAPLEGLWGMRMGCEFDLDRRDEWRWTLMILQPAQVTKDLLAQALAALRKKKDLPFLDELRLEIYDEGPAAQIMHLGPYGGEGPTIARLHRFISDQGYHLGGKHHEIYLSDPRRTAPEKLKTIIRQPITREAMK